MCILRIVHARHTSLVPSHLAIDQYSYEIRLKKKTRNEKQKIKKFLIDHSGLLSSVTRPPTNYTQLVYMYSLQWHMEYDNSDGADYLSSYAFPAQSNL